MASNQQARVYTKKKYVSVNDSWNIAKRKFLGSAGNS